MGESHGRVILAGEKGKLLSRLKRMSETQQLNRHEIDLELVEEIKNVKQQFNELDHVTNLWDRGEIMQYNKAFKQYVDKYGLSK